jgi:hypothetical protein
VPGDVRGFAPSPIPHKIVMLGLVPSIHDFFGGDETECKQKKAWMVGTRPTMTTVFGVSGTAIPSAM